MSNKLVYKIIPTHRCLGLLPHCAPRSPSLPLSLSALPAAAWPAACGLLGFCFMRGQAELEFATIVAWLVVLLLLWLVVASFSFAAINLLLNATIWLPLRRLHSALSPSPHCLQPPSCHCPLVRWSACPRHRHRMQSTYLGWSPTWPTSSCTVFGSSSRGNKNFVKWQ